MTAELATSLTSTDDERLEQAESVVRAYCGWHIAPVRTDEVIVLDGSDTDLLSLPTLRLSSISSITVEGEQIDADDYYIDRAGYVRRLSWRSWGRVPGGVTVTMTHGYADVPPAVAAVVKAVAQRAIDNPSSLIRNQVGPFSETYSQTSSNQTVPLALLEAERSLLAPYKLPSRP